MINVRSVRNRNPGNIRKGQPWLGLAPAEQQTDENFCVFLSPHYGFRALALTLLTYFHKYGLNTVQGIISRWAPANENDTTAYVNAVSVAVGTFPGNVLDVENPTTLQALCKAIAIHEAGNWFFQDGDLISGVSAALAQVSPPPA